VRAILIGILYRTLVAYIGGGVARRVQIVVEQLQDDELPGAAKREIAINLLSDEIERVGGIAIAAAIEVTLLKLRGPQ